MTKIDTGTEELLCELNQRVAVITLNKPHKKNALGDVLTPALRQLLLDLENRADIGCLLLTGAGNAFCSGGDVSEMGGGGNTLSTEERINELTTKQQTLTGRLYHFGKPTIAALPGAAAGAGMSIALACDIRIASENAFMVTAFRNVGLSGDYGASWFLPKLLGLARAKALLFRSERVMAAEALNIGLVDKVFPEDTFRQAAFDYAAEIANGPTEALARMKQNITAGLGQSLEESLALEAKNMIAAGSGDEAREAISAFREKRSPQFFRDS